MKVVSAQEIQKLDRIAIERIGIPSLILMENAGRRVAEIILRKVFHRPLQKVLVVCGLGNNAGDGLVAARYLWMAGVRTKIILIGRTTDLKHDAGVNGLILKKLKFPIKEVGQLGADTLRDIKNSSLIVDALFGVGLNRNITEPYASFIRAINRFGKYVVAVDVPSGLNATTGEVLGVCVQADLTVTFTLPKKGFFKKQGPACVGRVEVVDIGIPPSLFHFIP